MDNLFWRRCWFHHSAFLKGLIRAIRAMSPPARHHFAKATHTRTVVPLSLTSARRGTVIDRLCNLVSGDAHPPERIPGTNESPSGKTPHQIWVTRRKVFQTKKKNEPQETGYIAWHSVGAALVHFLALFPFTKASRKWPRSPRPQILTF